MMSEVSQNSKQEKRETWEKVYRCDEGGHDGGGFDMARGRGQEEWKWMSQLRKEYTFVILNSIKNK